MLAKGKITAYISTTVYSLNFKLLFILILLIIGLKIFKRIPQIPILEL